MIVRLLNVQDDKTFDKKLINNYFRIICIGINKIGAFELLNSKCEYFTEKITYINIANNTLELRIGKSILFFEII